MTKQEALLALKKGLKVTHPRLDQKWMKETDGMYVFSDGSEVRQSAFWVIRDGDKWDRSWDFYEGCNVVKIGKQYSITKPNIYFKKVYLDRNGSDWWYSKEALKFTLFETEEEYTFWKTLYWAHTIEEARQKMYESDRATLDRILARLSYLNISDNQFPVKTDDYFTFDNRGNKVIRKWENTDECLLLWKKHCSKWLCEGEFQTIKCEVVKDGENDVLKKEI